MGDDPHLREETVLNPRWITTGVYRILTDPTLAGRGGELGFADLAKILPKMEYPPAMHEFLIELMRKFDLCFPYHDDPDERRYLVPGLLRKEKPELRDPFAPVECLNSRYDYRLMPEGLVPRFIARTHTMSEPGERWREGVVLRWGTVARWWRRTNKNRKRSCGSGARGERARIYWADQMGARSDHQAGRSYAPRGKTPAALGTGRRFGCNMMSAITNRGDLAFMVFKGRFEAGVCLRFLRRLVRHARRKVFPIFDSHRVHRGKRVRAWLEANRERIEAFFLPGYSPDLNPDEMLNQDVKANAVGRKRPRDQRALMNNIRSYLEKRRNAPRLVRRHFHDPSVRYAMAR